TVQIHFLDFATYWGYVRCPGADCLLCRVGREPDTRDLLPVFDPVAKTVAVLAVSPNMRPQALKPQLTPVLRMLRDDRRVLAGIKKLDRSRYTVATFDMPADADDGAAEIQKFVEAFEAGSLDPRSVYRQMSNEELATIPEVASQMRLRSISL